MKNEENNEENVKLIVPERDEKGEEVPLGEEKENKNDKVLLGKCFAAVLVCYTIFAICHESITREVSLDREIIKKYFKNVSKIIKKYSKF